ARQVVLAKVGISFISTDQAKADIAEEIPAWNFDTTRTKATAAWDKALSVIELRGATGEQRTKVYTALYHTMLMPSDRTGENPYWPTSYPDHPYYDDYYAIWDTFRSSAPLLTLIAPERELDLIRSLIDIYKHTGYMPDARSGNDNGRTQGGSNANVMVAMHTSRASRASIMKPPSRPCSKMRRCLLRTSRRRAAAAFSTTT